MSNVLYNPFIYDTIINTIDIEATKSIAMKNEIIASLVRSLEEVKNPSFATKLATKHALLIIIIINNTGNNVSCKQKARTLGIHHRNIFVTMQWRRLMNLNGIFLWTLSIRKKDMMPCRMPQKLQLLHSGSRNKSES